MFLTDNADFFAEPDASAYWTIGTALAQRDTFWSTLLTMPQDANTDRMPLYPYTSGPMGIGIALLRL